jgi:hypothetical protein
MSRDFESTGRFEPWFQRTFPDRAPRMVAKFAIVILLFTLLGWVGGFVINKATSAPVAAAAAQLCVSDPGLACTIRTNVRHFKQGKLGRSEGYRAKLDNLYRRPAAAKRVWIHKIAAAIEEQNAELAAKGITARFAAADAPVLYRRSTRHASCASAGGYPAIATGKRTCNGYRVGRMNGPGLTKKQVQVGGAAVLCGTGVVLGLVAAGPTAGSIVYLLAGSGAASCLWATWAQVDPG